MNSKEIKKNMQRIKPSYIYLLIEREFLKTNEKIYKIGKTRQLNFKRFKQYPKGSMLLYQTWCDNCDTKERELLTHFRSKYKHRKDVGAEYFEGDYNNMIKDISGIIHGKIIYSESRPEKRSLLTKVFNWRPFS